jgi:hypothetical protein
MATIRTRPRDSDNISSNQNVFINCPFDADFLPILEAILFCVVDCGLSPRIASERLDSGEARLGKIVELIAASQLSIHDLSRVRTEAPNGLSRLNMPFELGLDYGMSLASEASKPLLILAEDRYLYQAALSDIAGWDIRAHDGDYESAIKRIRAWLNSHDLTDDASSSIIGDYYTFQEWDYERLLDAGWTESDIQERETPELLDAMRAWISAGRPVT